MSVLVVMYTYFRTVGLQSNFLLKMMSLWSLLVYEDGIMIAIEFLIEDDVTLVLAGVWRWDNVGMLVKRLMPIFDPRIERYDLLPIWVKLPNLPFEYWYVDFFKLVANTLGTYLEVDLSFLQSGICSLGKVLVLLDLSNGLAADILIKMGGSEFN